MKNFIELWCRDNGGSNTIFKVPIATARYMKIETIQSAIEKAGFAFQKSPPISVRVPLETLEVIVEFFTKRDSPWLPGDPLAILRRCDPGQIVQLWKASKSLDMKQLLEELESLSDSHLLFERMDGKLELEILDENSDTQTYAAGHSIISLSVFLKDTLYDCDSLKCKIRLSGINRDAMDEVMKFCTMCEEDPSIKSFNLYGCSGPSEFHNKHMHDIVQPCYGEFVDNLDDSLLVRVKNAAKALKIHCLELLMDLGIVFRQKACLENDCADDNSTLSIRERFHVFPPAVGISVISVTWYFVPRRVMYCRRCHSLVTDSHEFPEGEIQTMSISRTSLSQPSAGGLSDLDSNKVKDLLLAESIASISRTSLSQPSAGGLSVSSWPSSSKSMSVTDTQNALRGLGEHAKLSAGSTKEQSSISMDQSVLSWTSSLKPMSVTDTQSALCGLGEHAKLSVGSTKEQSSISMDQSVLSLTNSLESMSVTDAQKVLSALRRLGEQDDEDESKAHAPEGAEALEANDLGVDFLKDFDALPRSADSAESKRERRVVRAETKLIKENNQALEERERRVVRAPPGKLGIVIDTTDEGPVVHRIFPDSALKGQLRPGDIIVSIDDVDTRAMSLSAITDLMIKTAKQCRSLTVVYNPNFGIQIYNQAREDIISAAQRSGYEVGYSDYRCSRCGWGKKGPNHDTNADPTSEKFCTVAKEFYYHEEWEVRPGYQFNDNREPMGAQTFKNRWKRKRKNILGIEGDVDWRWNNW